jgi:stage III sporulation protein AG
MKMTRLLKKLFEEKDKKVLTNIMMAVALGVLLIVSGNIFFKKPPPETTQEIDGGAPAAESLIDYEAKLEQKLKNIYEMVEGAGNVSVMVTLSHGKEIVIAENIQKRESAVSERDANGGSREQNELDEKGEKIIISGSDGSRPLVLKEMEPVVEGVIIVAQGGDNIFIKDAFVKATVTALGVEPHKVQVLKMKN